MSERLPSRSGKTSIWSKDFICVMIANACLAMSHNAVNPLVSSYATLLGAGATAMGVLTGMFFGVALAMRPFAGPITTRLDHRKLMIFVYSLGCFVNIGYALFHGIVPFVIFRVFHGIQYSLIGSLCFTIAGKSLPREKMASGLGIFGVGGAIASAIAPSVGIALRDYGTRVRDAYFGYTLVFLYGATVLLLAVIPSFLLSKRDESDEPVDQGKWYTQIATKHAIGPAVVIFLLITAYSQFSSYMVPFGEEAGFGEVGTFFTVLALVMLMTRPLSGPLTDRLGLLKVLLPAIVVFAASFLITGSAVTKMTIYIGAVVAACGYGSANPAVQSMCVQSETPARRAIASNTLYIGIDLGYFLGPIIGGMIKETAQYRQVITFGFIPALLAGAAFLISYKPYMRRQEQLKKQ